MRKLFSLAIFVLFLSSCNTYLRNVARDEIEELQNRRHVDVMRLHTGNEGFVYFSNRYPGKLVNGEVTGVKHIPIQLFAADSVVYRVKGIKEIPLFVYSDGKKFDVLRENDVSLVYTTSLIQVPVSEVSNMELKKNGNRKLVFTGLVVGVAALSIYVISNMSMNVSDAF